MNFFDVKMYIVIQPYYNMNLEILNKNTTILHNPVKRTDKAPISRPEIKKIESLLYKVEELKAALRQKDFIIKDRNEKLKEKEKTIKELKYTNRVQDLQLLLFKDSKKTDTERLEYFCHEYLKCKPNFKCAKTADGFWLGRIYLEGNVYAEAMAKTRQAAELECSSILLKKFKFNRFVIEKFLLTKK